MWIEGKSHYRENQPRLVLEPAPLSLAASRWDKLDTWDWPISLDRSYPQYAAYEQLFRHYIPKGNRGFPSQNNPYFQLSEKNIWMWQISHLNNAIQAVHQQISRANIEFYRSKIDENNVAINQVNPNFGIYNYSIGALYLTDQRIPTSHFLEVQHFTTSNEDGFLSSGPLKILRTSTQFRLIGEKGKGGDLVVMVEDKGYMTKKTVGVYQDPINGVSAILYQRERYAGDHVHKE